MLEPELDSEFGFGFELGIGLGLGLGTEPHLERAREGVLRLVPLLKRHEAAAQVEDGPDMVAECSRTCAGQEFVQCQLELASCMRHTPLNVCHGDGVDGRVVSSDLYGALVVAICGFRFINQEVEVA